LILAALSTTAWASDTDKANEFRQGYSQVVIINLVIQWLRCFRKSDRRIKSVTKTLV
jgi:hypothetical protein